jgi:uncharacterized protein YbbK (DUF523 family)
MILVSACLCGQRCRYDGKTKENRDLMARLGRADILPLCPEALGGLPTPRPACELFGGDGADVLAGRARLVDESGVDRTAAFLEGAYRTLELVRSYGIRHCCLKAKSPSCGSRQLALQGALPEGYRPVLGVTAALLLANGFAIEEIP